LKRVSEYSPHTDHLYRAVLDDLLDAIQVVLTADKLAARKAHHVSPHLRLKDLNNLKNDNDLCNYGARRIFNIAQGLGIKVKLEIELPQDRTA
jgi:hypothetical protein